MIDQIIRPQQGPQTEFLSTKADICIFGGSAGSGKTYSILLEGLRNINNPKFGFTIFRRVSTQINTVGGLWDESLGLYSHFGSPISHKNSWKFRSGATAKFSHLQREDDVYSYQGSQIPLIIFDEVTHFTKKQFYYMLSRNRSTCGVRPYVRATCNPDPDSFILDFVEPFLGGDGYPRKELSGKIFYFALVNDEFKYDENPEKLTEKYKLRSRPLSFTFIPSLVEDNKILLAENPEYLSFLDSLPSIERARLRDGNWYIKDVSNRRYYSFDQNTHVQEFEPRGTSIYVGQDFNVDPMAGCLCEIWDDKIMIFDEIYLKDSNTYALRDHIKSKYGVANVNIIPDSTGKNRKTSAKLSDFEILREYGFNVMDTQNPFREDRFNCVNGLLEKNRIIIHPRCVNLIRDLNNCHKTEEGKDEGHITDGLGYIAWKFFPIVKKFKSKIRTGIY